MSEQSASTYDDLPEQMRVRRDKLTRMRSAGVEPYPVGFPRTTEIAALRAAYGNLAPDAHTGDRVGVVGRVMLNRVAGKLVFATIRDGSGEIQVMLSLDRVGAGALDDWKSYVDLGDHVGVEGEVISSRRGELSVLADRWALTAKALRPLPEKFKGLADPEQRVRQRYVDLIVNPDARRMVEIRSTVARSLRESLGRRGFVEIETPMLQPVHGGANARPFTTHFNAFDTDVYLRIALELHLKRLVVGGVEKVFELGRVLRNEGSDTTHSPEFTMLEVYEAYGDYDTMATLTRELYQEAAVAVFGSTTVTQLDGTQLDLGGEWRSVSLYDTVSAALGEELTPETSVDALRVHADKCDVAVDPSWGHGKLVEELLEALCQEALQAPTFVRDYPVETSPLTRPHRTVPGLAEKWDLYIAGVERATAYSELVDPIEQRERLRAQSLAAARGDPEAMQLDEDFLRALEYGMPPSGGLGAGLDRLLQVFTGRGIRETIPFPFVRPE